MGGLGYMKKQIFTQNIYLKKMLDVWKKEYMYIAHLN